MSGLGLNSRYSFSGGSTALGCVTAQGSQLVISMTANKIQPSMRPSWYATRFQMRILQLYTIYITLSQEPQSTICFRTQYDGGDRGIDPAIGGKASSGRPQTLLVLQFR